MRSIPPFPRMPEACKGCFKQFSFPGGIPSHVVPETPGSIHEGGELGYAVAHAYGAAFDNPDLIVACIVGDGEAETGPLAIAWHSNRFLNPGSDGAVLPILHLNGYKIANPTLLARISHEELRSLFVGHGYKPHSALFEVTDRTWMAEMLPEDNHLAAYGRVMEILSEHTCQGWLEGYLLTGRHGLFASYEAFIHIVDSMFNQHAKWLKVSGNEIPWRRPSPPSIISSRPTSGDRTTTASATKIPALSIMSSIKKPR